MNQFISQLVRGRVTYRDAFEKRRNKTHAKRKEQKVKDLENRR